MVVRTWKETNRKQGQKWGGQGVREGRRRGEQEGPTLDRRRRLS